MVQEFYENFSVRKVIVSRGRAETITTHKIVPSADLVVIRSEAKDYHRRCPDSKIITIPDDVIGLSRVRNWVFDNIDDEIVFMMDDDIHGLACLSVGYQSKKIEDVERIEQIIDNTARCAKDAGAKVWGFNVTEDIRKYRANLPFRFNGWTDCAWGVIGREVRCDENQMFKVDFDVCMQSLMLHRFIWLDSRYKFLNLRWQNKGGNNMFRTKEREEADYRYLKSKWRGHCRIAKFKSKFRLGSWVERQQAGVDTG